MWSISRQDKRLTKAAIATIDGNGKRAGRFVKNRLDPSCPEWRAICRARDAARATHYAYTLPWQEGLRLVNPLALEDYMDRMQEAENAFWTAVDEFLASAENLKGEAMLALGAYYREADYADLCRDAFDFGVAVSPMPHDAQFDAVAELIGSEKASELAQAMKARQEAQWLEATRDVWERVYKALRHASDQLHNGQRLHDSVMENLQELTDLLPVLNVTNDAELETARRELSALFRQYSAVSVKDQKNRKSCAAQVDAILAKLPSI
jgi:hypothetical protein